MQIFRRVKLTFNQWLYPSIVKEVLYFQRGQENVRNRTQVKLAASSLECKQAGRFSTLQYMLGGILLNEEVKEKELIEFRLFM